MKNFVNLFTYSFIFDQYEIVFPAIKERKINLTKINTVVSDFFSM